MPLDTVTVYEDSGLKSRVKLHAKQDSPRASKLDELIRRAGLIIFEAKTKFPYTLFPDKVTICPNRVTVSYGGPFFKNELPIMVESLTGAEVSQGFVFATLTIETFGVTKPEPIRYLKKNDARMARRYILALIECKKNSIDLNQMPVEMLRKKLKKIGRVYK
jgi:hypothetical protein